MQKLVCVDSTWQARVYPIGGEAGMRKKWEKCKVRKLRMSYCSQVRFL